MPPPDAFQWNNIGGPASPLVSDDRHAPKGGEEIIDGHGNVDGLITALELGPDEAADEPDSRRPFHEYDAIIHANTLQSTSPAPNVVRANLLTQVKDVAPFIAASRVFMRPTDETVCRELAA